MTNHSDYSSLAVYGNLFSVESKKASKKTNKAKVSDLAVYGNLSSRSSKAERDARARKSNQKA